MFTTVITCIQAKDRSTEIKTHTELGYRLPKDVQPRHYNIKIEFSETLDHLNGECEIDIEIFKATSNIRLYNPEPKKQPMYYHKIKLNMKNSADESIADEYPVEIGYSEEEYILNLYFNQQLSPGNYSLFIKYETNISKGIQKGYFIKILFPPEARSEARQNTLLATNIHSIEARHLFPCWDEPELKATFQFRFTHQQKYKIWPISVSGRSTRDDYKQNWLCTNFFIKDKISTYQLMFILTDFEFYIKTKVITYNALALFHTVIKLSIASRPRVENSMQFLYNVSNKILHSMWWWHHKLPLRRNITLLAIPAMKEDVIANRGLILYKESLVTYDKQIDSYVRQREVASIVARGIAYQLVEEIIVTLPWWSHLWFNKGLATLLHVMILDEVFGKWGFMDLFVVQVHQDCLHLDTNFIMKPLSYEVQTSSEIKSLFSFPIYVKGYYRVKYDNDSLEFITNYLKFMEFKKIHVLNRAQIIDDTYYFLMRGEVTYDTFVRLMYYLARDRNYIAWYPMFQIFIDLLYFLPFAESEVIKVKIVIYLVKSY
ncbi:Aminopeptidase N [Ooceraea biroi]|uniref:Aminopeptidase N n=1 Tax=Ooceraea biroi TaxID=2015173 RepID=A0A026W6S6_OOCBI|nr:Aminopeptidase N [Ooceraea biroi]